MVRGSPVSSLHTLEPTCDALLHFYTADFVTCTKTFELPFSLLCMMVSLHDGEPIC